MTKVELMIYAFLNRKPLVGTKDCERGDRKEENAQNEKCMYFAN